MADPTKVARMLEAISAGVPISQALLHAGISSTAHYRSIDLADQADEWDDAAHAARARGEEPADASPDPGRVHREYRDSVLRARADVAVVNVALVAKAARGGAVVRETTRREPDGTVTTEREFARGEWKAAQFLLATSFREEFGAPTRRQVEHSGPGGGPIEHASPSDAVVQTLAERLASVAEAQRQELPGGWSAGQEPAVSSRAIAAGPSVRADLDVEDAEIVDDVADGAR